LNPNLDSAYLLLTFLAKDSEKLQPNETVAHNATNAHKRDITEEHICIPGLLSEIKLHLASSEKNVEIGATFSETDICLLTPSREGEKLLTALRRSEWNLSWRCEHSDIRLIKFHEGSLTEGELKGELRRLCRRGRKFRGRNRARERKFFRTRLVIKERKREKRKNFSKVFRFLSFSFSPVRWQNWILVKAPSRSADRHRHFRVARPTHNPDSFPSFLSASLNYISLRTFVIAMARYPGQLSVPRRTWTVCITSFRAKPRIVCVYVMGV